jgi:hypothetical protein
VNPIYEQGKGEGIGYGVADFHRRFEKICADHLNTHRAKAFAFIFYDFEDKDIRRVLKTLGVFAELDRLSGKELSVFYLHTSSSKRTVLEFNNEFLRKLGAQDAVPPCVVFFRLLENGIGDVAVAQLNNADLVHGFHELYGVIGEYVQHGAARVPTDSRYLKWLKGTAGIVAKEAFDSTVKAMLEILKKSLMG